MFNTESKDSVNNDSIQLCGTRDSMLVSIEETSPTATGMKKGSPRQKPDQGSETSKTEELNIRKSTEYGFRSKIERLNRQGKNPKL